MPDVIIIIESVADPVDRVLLLLLPANASPPLLLPPPLLRVNPGTTFSVGSRATSVALTRATSNLATPSAIPSLGVERPAARSDPLATRVIAALSLALLAGVTLATTGEFYRCHCGST